MECGQMQQYLVLKRPSVSPIALSHFCQSTERSFSWVVATFHSRPKVNTFGAELPREVWLDPQLEAEPLRHTRLRSAKLTDRLMRRSDCCFKSLSLGWFLKQPCVVTELTDTVRGYKYLWGIGLVCLGLTPTWIEESNLENKQWQFQ